MSALLEAAPLAVRHERGKKSAAAEFPEFRAWHAMLEPLFGVTPPDWTEKAAPQIQFELSADSGSEEVGGVGEEEEEEDDE